MALPIVRNINYYRGNTYTERIKPKTANGGAWDLTNYQAYFYIDTDRDGLEGAGFLTGVTDVNVSEGHITYTITPAIGIQMTGGTTYVFEVNIKNTVTGEVYTLETGNIITSANVKNLT